MKNKIFLLTIIFVSNLYSQQMVDFKTLVDSNTTKVERQKFREQTINETIRKNLLLLLNDVNEAKWQEAFEASEVMLFKDALIYKSLKQSLSDFKKRSTGFQRATLEAVYCLYPKEFSNEILNIARTTDNPKLFAMSVNYLIRAIPTEKLKSDLAKLMKTKFNNWKENPILYMLDVRLFSKQKTPAISLIEVLRNTAPGELVIFSLQRRNRDYQGLVLIRKPDGSFVRDNFGKIFNIPQLARGIANLPGYITDGNTPQGILSVQGVDTSKSIFIGSTPNIQLILPFENKYIKYFHKTEEIKDTSWLDSYANLLPAKYNDNPLFYEAYYAGKAGRTEIISHGTTIDPEFYKGQPYYPNTPTLGCLCAKELWSDTDGKCLISDQAALMNAFYSAGSLNGYLMVVELDNQNKPVILDEVLVDVLNSEKK
jgi:hypothetical protein